MIRVLIEKRCPKCNKTQYVKAEVTDTQWSWLEEHPEHPEHCPKCQHYGRLSRPIDLDKIQQRFWKTKRPDQIAEKLQITVSVAAKALEDPSDRKEWNEIWKKIQAVQREVRRMEKAEAKKKAKKKVRTA